MRPLQSVQRRTGFETLEAKKLFAADLMGGAAIDLPDTDVVAGFEDGDASFHYSRSYDPTFVPDLYYSRGIRVSGPADGGTTGIEADFETDNPESSNPTPHPMPVPELSDSVSKHRLEHSPGMDAEIWTDGTMSSVSEFPAKTSPPTSGDERLYSRSDGGIVGETGEQHEIYDYSQCIWNDITFNCHATPDAQSDNLRGSVTVNFVNDNDSRVAGEQHEIYDYSQCIWNDITFNCHATPDAQSDNLRGSVTVNFVNDNDSRVAGEQHEIYDYSQCIWNDITFNCHATPDAQSDNLRGSVTVNFVNDNDSRVAGEQHEIYDYSQCIWNDITFNCHATPDAQSDNLRGSVTVNFVNDNDSRVAGEQHEIYDYSQCIWNDITFNCHATPDAQSDNL